MTPLDIPELAFVRTLNVPRLRKLLGREKRTCTWCGKSLVGTRRKSWCSDACWQEYNQRWNAGEIRRLTFARDKGVCQSCGCDCHYWQKKYQLLTKGWYHIDLKQPCEFCKPDENHAWGVAYRKNRRGRKNLRKMTRYQENCKQIKQLMSWEADHIVPVVRGGAMLGMANIRTLCQRCHKCETAALAALRSKEREPPELQKQQPVFRELRLF